MSGAAGTDMNSSTTGRPRFASRPRPSTSGSGRTPTHQIRGSRSIHRLRWPARPGSVPASRVLKQLPLCRRLLCRCSRRRDPACRGPGLRPAAEPATRSAAAARRRRDEPAPRCRGHGFRHRGRGERRDPRPPRMTAAVFASVLRGSGVTTPGPGAVVCPGEAGQGERADQEPEVSQGDVVEARVRQQVNDDAREP